MITAGPLTVKHVEHSGLETIIQALSISYHPGRPGMEREGGGEDCPSVTALGCPSDDGLGANNVYASGIVYVTNEAGATVGKYHLSSPPLGERVAYTGMGEGPR